MTKPQSSFSSESQRDEYAGFSFKAPPQTPVISDAQFKLED